MGTSGSGQKEREVKDDEMDKFQVLAHFIDPELI
jgi:hypothetical protein